MFPSNRKERASDHEKVFANLGYADMQMDWHRTTNRALSNILAPYYSTFILDQLFILLINSPNVSVKKIGKEEELGAVQWHELC